MSSEHEGRVVICTTSGNCAIVEFGSVVTISTTTNPDEKVQMSYPEWTEFCKHIVSGDLVLEEQPKKLEKL